MRGTIPGALIKQVAAATYHLVWWPQFENPVYTVAKPPMWDAETEAYRDPRTGQPLATWQEALETIGQ